MSVIRFERAEVEPGVLEVTVRFSGRPVTGPLDILEGIEAQKRFIKWVLASASGMLREYPHDGFDCWMHDQMLALCKAVDEQQGVGLDDEVS